VSRKPYSVKPSLEHLREMKNLSPKEKLEWLEEANQFVATFVPVENFERWRRVTSSQQDSKAASNI